jgi:dTDP-glucose pyrophosphorylase
MAAWPPSIYSDLNQICIGPTATIRDAIGCIDRSDRAIALVIDESGCLLDTITDGDIRRALLASVDLTAPIGSLRNRRKTSRYPVPVTAPITADPQDVLGTMEKQHLQQVPLLDDNGRVAGIVTRRDLCPSEPLTLTAVVMAGGEGARLRPLTADLPKPMLPMGGRPLMEHIITQLEHAGIKRVHITTHYHAEKIMEHFGDGQAFGLALSYVNEDRPLGTAGGLALLQPSDEPLLVMNGDIVTQVDFRSMYAYHREHQASLTVAVRAYEVKVPYGVMECAGTHVTAVREKPQLNLFVNAGIYLLEPSALQYIPQGRRFDMTDLIQVLIELGSPVVSFPIHEYWIDIGEHDNYVKAQHDMSSGIARTRQQHA